MESYRKCKAVIKEVEISLDGRTEKKEIAIQAIQRVSDLRYFYCVDGNPDYAQYLEDVKNGSEVLPFDYEAEAAAEAEYERLNGYKWKRAKEYDPIPDQLDRIFKAFKYLKEHGVDIGPDGEEFVARNQAVKDKYPKP